MEYFKKISVLLFFFSMVMTVFAQQPPAISLKEPVNETDLTVGRTHYEDDIVFDNVIGNSEPEVQERTNSEARNSELNVSLPNGYRLFVNYPNPFNPATNIKFSIPEKGFVILAVYDAAGRHVSTLVNSQLSPGTHEARFDAAGLSSGLYFYMITVNNFTDVKKMILIK
jgi:hypothetical protein